MKAFTVHDKEVGLLDLLTLKRSAVERSRWDCHHVDVIGPAAGEFRTAAIPSDRRSLPGHELLRLAAAVEQLLDGDFSGYALESLEPWLTVRSVRGMYFVVITADDSLVAALQNRFQDVRESPDDVGYVA